MAHLWTPQDLPADFKLGWYHFPDSSTVTLDANGKIAQIENKFDNGSRPCATADATKRHLIQKYNGYDTAFSDTTNYGGILMTNTSGLPTGNADLCMIFIQAPQDGVVGGFRGGNNFWVDNPYPDYRMRTDKGDYTLTGTTNNSTLHVLIVNRKSGTSTFRVDGMARGSQTPSGGYNTTLGTFGIKGADANYYVQKGSSLGAIVGKRAATADEMYLIEKWYSTFTGQTVQSDNPYINGLPMVADGGGTSAAVDGASQPHAAASPTLAGRSATTPDAAAQGQAATSPTVVARGSASVDSAAQPIATTSPTLATRATTAADSTAQGQAAMAPMLSVSGVASVATASQQQVASSPSLAARSTVAADSAAQPQPSPSPALSNVRSATSPASAAQSQTSGQPTVSGAGSVSVVDATQAHSASSPALLARSSIAALAATQTQASTAPTLSARQSVSVVSAAQAQAGSSPSVMSRAAVTPAGASQTHASSAPALSANVLLLVSSALQTQAATSPALFVGERPLPPSTRTVRSIRLSRVARSPRPSRLAA